MISIQCIMIAAAATVIVSTENRKFCVKSIVQCGTDQHRMFKHCYWHIVFRLFCDENTDMKCIYESMHFIFPFKCNSKIHCRQTKQARIKQSRELDTYTKTRIHKRTIATKRQDENNKNWGNLMDLYWSGWYGEI